MFSSNNALNAFAEDFSEVVSFLPVTERFGRIVHPFGCSTALAVQTARMFPAVCTVAASSAEQGFGLTRENGQAFGFRYPRVGITNLFLGKRALP